MIRFVCVLYGRFLCLYRGNIGFKMWSEISFSGIRGRGIDWRSCRGFFIANNLANFVFGKFDWRWEHWICWGFWFFYLKKLYFRLFDDHEAEILESRKKERDYPYFEWIVHDSIEGIVVLFLWNFDSVHNSRMIWSKNESYVRERFGRFRDELLISKRVVQFWKIMKWSNHL